MAKQRRISTETAPKRGNPCTACEETGYVTDPGGETPTWGNKRNPWISGTGKWKTCPTCKGSGKKRGRPPLT